MQNEKKYNAMEMSKLEESVLDIINSVNSTEATLESSLNDLGINSIDFIRIIVTLEDEFDFEFENEMLLYESFSDINSIVKYIGFKLWGKS